MIEANRNESAFAARIELAVAEYARGVDDTQRR